MIEGKNVYEWMKWLGVYDVGVGVVMIKLGCEVLMIGMYCLYRVVCLASTSTRLEKF